MTIFSFKAMAQYNKVQNGDTLEIEIHQSLDASSVVSLVGDLENSDCIELSVNLKDSVSADFMLIQAIAYLRKKGKNIQLNLSTEPSPLVQFVIKNITK